MTTLWDISSIINHSWQIRYYLVICFERFKSNIFFTPWTNSQKLVVAIASWNNTLLLLFKNWFRSEILWQPNQYFSINFLYLPIHSLFSNLGFSHHFQTLVYGRIIIFVILPLNSENLVCRFVSLNVNSNSLVTHDLFHNAQSTMTGAKLAPGRYS